MSGSFGILKFVYKTTRASTWSALGQVQAIGEQTRNICLDQLVLYSLLSMAATLNSSGISPEQMPNRTMKNIGHDAIRSTMMDLVNFLLEDDATCHR